MTDVVAQLNGALAGHYEIERELGAGGMATVYLARDLKHDRRVAIKILHPELAAVLGSERFVAEMKVTANLQHPHILPLFDSGTAGEQLFYVMPFVDGESLRDRLNREQQLSVDEAIRITTEVASALDYAHRHGVVHRDVKPENILLHDGSALVADFGIALAVSNAGGQRLTQTGLSLGTPQYMSPEQATGQRNIDGRTDVYSLGCVLYEMLIGEPPFTGPNSQAVIAKVLTEAITPLRARRPIITPGQEAAVLRATQRIAADRFPSANAFAEALRRDGVVDRQFAPATRARLSEYRWPIAAAASVVAIAIAALVLRREPPLRDYQLRRQVTFDGIVSAVAISPDGNSIAYVTDECVGGSCEGGKNILVRDINGTQSVTVAHGWSFITEVKWSRDGKVLAIRGTPDTSAMAVYLTDRLGGSLRAIRMSASAMSFTPDSKFIAIVAGPSGHQRLFHYDVETRQPRDSSALAVGISLYDLDYAPDGKRIAAMFLVKDVTLGLMRTNGELLDTTHASASVVRWTPEGDGVLQFDATPGVAWNLSRVDVRGDHLDSRRTSAVLGQIRALQFDVSSSGRIAVVSSPTVYSTLLHTDSASAPWRSLTNRTGLVLPYDISPDGRSVLLAATDNRAENILELSLDGKAAPRWVTTSGDEHLMASYSPDGKQIAYIDWRAGVGRLVRQDASGRERVLMSPATLSPAWVSNDRLVMWYADSLIRVDTSGKRLPSIAIPPQYALSPGSIAPVADRALPRLAYWSDTARAVVVVDEKSGTFRAIPEAVPVVPVGWGRDGSVYAGTNRPGGRRLVRIPPQGGNPITVLDSPGYCYYVLDLDARHVICGAMQARPDVWIAEPAGTFRW